MLLLGRELAPESHEGESAHKECQRPLQGVDESEPADEPLVRPVRGAESSGDRLLVEVYVELHAQRALVVVVIVHSANVRSRSDAGVGEVPDALPEVSSRGRPQGVQRGRVGVSAMARASFPRPVTPSLR